MNENYSTTIATPTKSAGTRAARAFLHLFTVGVALIGGLVSMLGFAAASAARTGAGFFGCGDGVPNPEGAQEALSFAIIAAVVTVPKPATAPRRAEALASS
jgi:hypothetical protein